MGEAATYSGMEEKPSVRPFALGPSPARPLAGEGGPPGAYSEGTYSSRVLFRVVKSQAADREIDDFMTVPRSRPG